MQDREEVVGWYVFGADKYNRVVHVRTVLQCSIIIITINTEVYILYGINTAYYIAPLQMKHSA